MARYNMSDNESKGVKVARWIVFVVSHLFLVLCCYPYFGADLMVLATHFLLHLHGKIFDSSGVYSQKGKGIIRNIK